LRLFPDEGCVGTQDRATRSYQKLLPSINMQMHNCGRLLPRTN